MKSTRSFLPLLFIVVGAIGARAQCPIDEAFPYLFCKNGAAVIRCASDPHHVVEDGVKLKPFKRTLPGCIVQEKPKLVPVYMPSPSINGDDYVPVFIPNNQGADIADAFNQWAGLCPATADHDCCAKVYFSQNPFDFQGDPDMPGRISNTVNGNTCTPTCQQTDRIYINDTPAWLFRTASPTPSSDLVRSFYTTRYAPKLAFGYTAYSLYQFMEAAVGAWFGLRGGDDDPAARRCSHPYSVVEHPTPERDASDLTAADICQFKKLYCDHAVGLGVADEETVEMELSQNLPNPFSQMTTIPYSIMRAGNVSLRMFDATGKELRVLVDEHQEAGRYTYGFHADESMPAGTYWYVLQVDGKTVSRQMVLVR